MIPIPYRLNIHTPAGTNAFPALQTGEKPPSLTLGAAINQGAKTKI
jgi:hypothetical protein